MIQPLSPLQFASRQQTIALSPEAGSGSDPSFFHVLSDVIEQEPPTPEVSLPDLHISYVSLGTRMKSNHFVISTQLVPTGLESARGLEGIALSLTLRCAHPDVTLFQPETPLPEATDPESELVSPQAPLQQVDLGSAAFPVAARVGAESLLQFQQPQQNPAPAGFIPESRELTPNAVPNQARTVSETQQQMQNNPIERAEETNPTPTSQTGRVVLVADPDVTLFQPKTPLLEAIDPESEPVSPQAPLQPADLGSAAFPVARVRAESLLQSQQPQQNPAPVGFILESRELTPHAVPNQARTVSETQQQMQNNPIEPAKEINPTPTSQTGRGVLVADPDATLFQPETSLPIPQPWPPPANESDQARLQPLKPLQTLTGFVPPAPKELTEQESTFSAPAVLLEEADLIRVLSQAEQPILPARHQSVVYQTPLEPVLNLSESILNKVTQFPMGLSSRQPNVLQVFHPESLATQQPPIRIANSNDLKETFETDRSRSSGLPSSNPLDVPASASVAGEAALVGVEARSHTKTSIDDDRAAVASEERSPAKASIDSRAEDTGAEDSCEKNSTEKNSTEKNSTDQALSVDNPTDAPFTDPLVASQNKPLEPAVLPAGSQTTPNHTLIQPTWNSPDTNLNKVPQSPNSPLKPKAHSIPLSQLETPVIKTPTVPRQIAHPKATPLSGSEMKPVAVSANETIFPDPYPSGPTATQHPAKGASGETRMESQAMGISANGLSVSQVIAAVNQNLPLHYVDFPRFIQQVISTHQGPPDVLQTISVTLQPQDIGEITASFMLHANRQVTIAITAQTPMAQQILESQAQEIQELMAACHYAVRAIQVKPATSGSFNQQQQQQQHAGAKQGGFSRKDKWGSSRRSRTEEDMNGEVAI